MQLVLQWEYREYIIQFLGCCLTLFVFVPEGHLPDGLLLTFAGKLGV